MRVELAVSTMRGDGRAFFGWTPVSVTAALREPPAGAGPANITVRSGGSLGRLVFGKTREASGTSTLQLSLPHDGSAVTFWVAGEFRFASTEYGDAKIDVVETTTSALLGSA